ncbi:MAG: LysR substrate-binding domain-containing protein [Crocinitomicaceae bacterium]|nr:LysR substrate-binding domain-containing protein [Crocinitomicaceae bacterium]
MIENYYNITPQQINYIIELNNERNFQRASEKCFVTQPTLSMQIKKVEELLGFSIFERSKNPIELTKEGEDLIQILKDIQTEYSRITTLAQKISGNHIESLRIAIIPTISTYLITDVFETIRKTNPQLQLYIEELKSEDLIVAMDEGLFDVGIMAGPQISRRMRTIHLFQEEILIYYPEGNGDTISPKEIDSVQPWLLSKGNCLRTQMVNFCGINDKNDTHQWNYIGGNLDILIKMVDLNGGYTLIPENYTFQSTGKKHLYDRDTKEYPARQVIALTPIKSSKKESIDTLISIIQSHYNTKKRDDFRILDWK